ncbi:hypothetical protein C3L33_07979, partial [Rhododendron williamsianum]
MTKPTTNFFPSPHSTLRPIFKLHPVPPPSTPTKPSLKILCSQNPPPSNPNPSPKQTLTLVSILSAIPNWADTIQERGMRQNRTLYNHETWVQHRSSYRHIRHFLSSLSSRVILSLIPPVIAFTSFAVLIAGYNSAVFVHWLPEFFPTLRASSLPYQLTAPALALLLVFRTEASYSRFEEGRKAWTKVVAGTNDFARQCHLIYGSDMERDLENLLEADDLAVVLSSKHRPRCIIEFISQGLQMLHLEESKRNLLESKISCFHEGIGVCEQLMGIPIPLSYTRLTSRFLVLWHLTLPIILWEDCNWIVVPATFISAASLFCIEEVGVLIEEPFPMLALDELCKVVHNNIRESIASEKLIQVQLNAKRKSPATEHSPNGRPTS